MDNTTPPDRHGAKRWSLIAGLGVVAMALVFVGRFLFYPNRTETPNPIPAETATEEDQRAKGKAAYANYCLQCHGEKGDGKGPAARFLYPKPRDFGEAKFRLVSTTNGKPSDDDLMQVINRGMPGSAMFPFAHLSESDRKALVAHVRHLTRTGMIDAARESTIQMGEAVDLDDIAETVDAALKPGNAIAIPDDLPPPSAASVARGRILYAKSCSSCHGATGKGDGAQDQKDSKGVAIRPRDFGSGIFKGGSTPRQLYTRIFLGMPGSPMPASARDSTPAEIGDLVNFILSLSDPVSRTKAEQRRTRIVAKRITGSLPDAITDETWQAVERVPIVVSPLWWRDYPEPALQVAAVHDGRSLAVRLTWQDTTSNDRMIRPQDFEDMAAIQLFQGSPEPFLGMGASDKPVDVWLWRAGGHTKPSEFVDVEKVYPNMIVDLYPFEKPAAGARHHATENQAPEFLTARAAGNPRSDPSQPFTGGSLQAKGFGTLSMRPRVSQVVQAKGQWQDGRWTVVLRRPLTVNPEDGIALKPEDRLSIAFALWDGAAGDRDGQKLVSIWHDLQLE